MRRAESGLAADSNGYALPPSTVESWSFTRWPIRKARCRIIMAARYLHAALFGQGERIGCATIPAILVRPRPLVIKSTLHVRLDRFATHKHRDVEHFGQAHNKICSVQQDIENPRVGRELAQLETVSPAAWESGPKPMGFLNR